VRPLLRDSLRGDETYRNGGAPFVARQAEGAVELRRRFAFDEVRAAAMNRACSG
jgi:hypothetical protein